LKSSNLTSKKFFQGEISVRQEESSKYKISSNLFKKFGLRDKSEMLFTADLDFSRMSADGTLTIDGNKMLYRVSSWENSSWDVKVLKSIIKLMLNRIK